LLPRAGGPGNSHLPVAALPSPRAPRAGADLGPDRARDAGYGHDARPGSRRRRPYERLATVLPLTLTAGQAFARPSRWSHSRRLVATLEEQPFDGARPADGR